MKIPYVSAEDVREWLLNILLLVVIIFCSIIGLMTTSGNKSRKATKCDCKCQENESISNKNKSVFIRRQVRYNNENLFFRNSNL